MAGHEKTVKFVRGIRPVTGSSSWTAGQGSLLWMKVLYEFWGFCVGGDNNLRSPGVGSFASISGSLAPNYLKMLPGFESGSTVLIASGSDGTTSYGKNIFSSTSVNFLSLTGTIDTGRRFLVTWKSGSTSTDDGIYPILQVLNSQSIVVDTKTGGTPMSASNNQPMFTDRTSINFRVIDMWGLANLTGYAQDDYMILQFNAQAINAGQASSQARLRFFSGSSSGPDAAAFQLSPSGSWNGSSFSDLSPEYVPDSANLNEGGVGGSPRWLSADASYYFSFYADQGAIVSHSMLGAFFPEFNSPSNFHIEIPNRLFPQSKDPNPVCCLNCCATNGHQSMGTQNFFTTRYFGAGWVLANPLDNLALRRYHPLVKNLFGSNVGAGGLYGGNNGNAMGFIGNGRYADAFFNPLTRKYIVQDIILAHRITGSSYTMGRVQLRRVAFATGPYERMRKLGTNGEWIAIADGILWPWDNANLPRTAYPIGRPENGNTM